MRQYRTPAETMEALVQCRTNGDLEGALAAYCEDAIIMVAPMKQRQGLEAVRTFLEGFMRLNPTFVVVERSFIVATDVAIHMSHWSLTGTDSNQQSFAEEGLSADVLRKQASGEWLLAIDNPFAAIPGLVP